MNVGDMYTVGGKVEVESLSVVCAQLAPINAQNMDDVEKNVDQILDYMDKASGGFPGYDMFVSSECALQGFHPAKWTDVLVDLDGPEIQRLRDKCKELEVWGVFNPLVRQKDGKAPANTAIIVNDKGDIVHEYVKMNPWIPGEPTYPGNKCPVTPGPKGSKLATIICFDGDFPEAWREAASNGANVIIRVSHYMGPIEFGWRLGNLAGAYFNRCYVVACNSIGIDEVYTYCGMSMVVDPEGKVITEAPIALPWLFKAELYPQLVDQIRSKYVTSNLLYSYKHRGASCKDFGGMGDLKSPYTTYKNWK